MFPFSQKEIVSFEEIKNIHSIETFEKIMIEKGFELYPEDPSWSEKFFSPVGTKQVYSYNLNESDNYLDWTLSTFNNAQMWAAWYNDNTFVFHTLRDIDYSNVFSDVKNECEFYGVLKRSLSDSFLKNNNISEDIKNYFKERHSCYTCPGSKYTGKICFMKQTIRTLIPD